MMDKTTSISDSLHIGKDSALTGCYACAIQPICSIKKGGNMDFVEKTINEYLDAISSVHGKEYRDSMVVADRGAGNIMVKYPDHEEGMAVSLGTLELMTKNLHSRVEESA